MGPSSGDHKLDFTLRSQTTARMQAIIPFPNISPDLISFDIAGFTLAIRWYALAYIAGILTAWRLALWCVARPALWPAGIAPMTREQVEDYMTWAILGIILGGRLGFVLFYQPAYYLSNPAEILAVWQGGMSFHGGLLGVIIASYIYARRQKLALMSTTDLIALCVPPGLFFGRIANFINAELWGRPTLVPWAVAFPGARAQDCPPEFGIPCGRHPSQLYEAGLEGLILGLLLLYLATRMGWLRHPGRIAAVFFAGYGVARFVVEYFRLADPQFITPDNPLGHVLALGPVGITMGQLLSLPMIAVGAILWAYSKRAK